MKKVTILALLCIVFGTPIAKAQKFQYATSSDEGYTISIMPNLLDIEQENGAKRIWTKMEGHPLSYKSGVERIVLATGYCLDLTDYDCAGKRCKLILKMFYSADGTFLYLSKATGAAAQWQNILPDTIAENILYALK